MWAFNGNLLIPYPNIHQITSVFSITLHGKYIPGHHWLSCSHECVPGDVKPLLQKRRVALPHS